VLWDAVATANVQHQRVVDRVKRLHQIDVQRPRTQPVLFQLEQGYLEDYSEIYYFDTLVRSRGAVTVRMRDSLTDSV
jgi:hypothetical protein